MKRRVKKHRESQKLHCTSSAQRRRTHRHLEHTHRSKRELEQQNKPTRQLWQGFFQKLQAPTRRLKASPKVAGIWWHVFWSRSFLRTLPERWLPWESWRSSRNVRQIALPSFNCEVQGSESDRRRRGVKNFLVRRRSRTKNGACQALCYSMYLKHFERLEVTRVARLGKVAWRKTLRESFFSAKEEQERAFDRRSAMLRSSLDSLEFGRTSSVLVHGFLHEEELCKVPLTSHFSLDVIFFCEG